jgi:hypothetical protein
VPSNDDQRLLELRFNTGQAGIVDLADELWGPVFEPLHHRGLFSEAVLNPLFHTVTWPNGADFAPEYLLDLLQRQSKDTRHENRL